MLGAERLDALLVCTPPDAHREVGPRRREAGLAVYLEKPVAHTIDDARRSRRRSKAPASCARSATSTGRSRSWPTCRATRGSCWAPGERHRGPAWLGDRAPGRRDDARAREPPHRPRAGDRGRGRGASAPSSPAMRWRPPCGSPAARWATSSSGGWPAGPAGGSSSCATAARSRGARSGLPRDRPGPRPAPHRPTPGRALARDVRRRRRAARPGAVCCTVADGVGTLAVALAAQDAALAAQSALDALSAAGAGRAGAGGRPAAGGRGDRGRGVHAGASRPASPFAF